MEQMEIAREPRSFLDAEGRLKALPAKQNKRMLALGICMTAWRRNEPNRNRKSTACSTSGRASGLPPRCGGNCIITIF